jgi:hypothetical protein
VTGATTTEIVASGQGEAVLEVDLGGRLEIRVQPA